MHSHPTACCHRSQALLRAARETRNSANPRRGEPTPSSAPTPTRARVGTAGRVHRRSAIRHADPSHAQLRSTEHSRTHTLSCGLRCETPERLLVDRRSPLGRASIGFAYTRPIEGWRRSSGPCEAALRHSKRSEQDACAVPGQSYNGRSEHVRACQRKRSVTPDHGTSRQGLARGIRILYWPKVD